LASYRVTCASYLSHTSGIRSEIQQFSLHFWGGTRRLVESFGIEKTYILSAGWGLISSSFLTPYYDITFSHSADRYKWRKRGDKYRDFCPIPNDTDEPIVFLGGKDYLWLFTTLTGQISASKTVFYNSARAPVAPGCALQRFETTTRTSWHYECADALLRSYV
jgi:hypothetical protein